MRGKRLSPRAVENFHIALYQVHSHVLPFLSNDFSKLQLFIFIPLHKIVLNPFIVMFSCLFLLLLFYLLIPALNPKSSIFIWVLSKILSHEFLSFISFAFRVLAFNLINLQPFIQYFTCHLFSFMILTVNLLPSLDFLVSHFNPYFIFPPFSMF